MLSIFAGLIKWTTLCDDELVTEGDIDDNDDAIRGGPAVPFRGRGQRPTDADCFALFTDEWLLYGCELTDIAQLTSLMGGSNQSSHPAVQTARMCTGLPRYPAQWKFPTHDWELWAAWPTLQASILVPVVRSGCVLSHFYNPGKFDASYNGNWLYSKSRPMLFVLQLDSSLLLASMIPTVNMS